MADLAAARREAEEALALIESPASDAMTIRHLDRALRSLLAATAPAPPPSDAIREAAPSVLGWATLAVALLQRHSSAWDHDPGPGDDDCDEYCRACEYVALLRTGKAALASRGGRS